MKEFDNSKRIAAIDEIEKLGVDNAVYAYFYQVPFAIAMRDNINPEDVWFHPGVDWIPSPAYKKK
jgi:hypothetical protein